jgi:hypothetical protein
MSDMTLPLSLPLPLPCERARERDWPNEPPRSVTDAGDAGLVALAAPRADVFDAAAELIEGVRRREGGTSGIEGATERGCGRETVTGGESAGSGRAPGNLACDDVDVGDAARTNDDCDWLCECWREMGGAIGDDAMIAAADGAGSACVDVGFECAGDGALLRAAAAAAVAAAVDERTVCSRVAPPRL